MMKVRRQHHGMADGFLGISDDRVPQSCLHKDEGVFFVILKNYIRLRQGPHHIPSTGSIRNLTRPTRWTWRTLALLALQWIENVAASVSAKSQFRSSARSCSRRPSVVIAYGYACCSVNAAKIR